MSLFSGNGVPGSSSNRINRLWDLGVTEAYVQLNELAAVEGFDEETAQELQTRAQEFIEAQNREMDERRRELGVG